MDDMPRIGALNAEFGRLIRQLFVELGFSVEDVHKRGPYAGDFDFVASLGTSRLAIETKYYRTARPQMSLLQSAVLRVAEAASELGFEAVLVVGCSLTTAQRAFLTEVAQVRLVDRSDILASAVDHPGSYDRLRALLDDGESSGLSLAGSGITLRAKAHVQSGPRPARSAPIQLGAALCKELKALKCGNGTWSAYERLGVNILKFLFDSEMLGWRIQKRSDDGLNRMDAICRIAPVTDFWKFVSDHLDTRYVVFEFKNHCNRIRQGEILTTEKYLIDRALRKVAIILCRAKPHRSAIAMSKGAMREAGNLILMLDDEVVCKMLHMKDKGDDPSDLLFDIADEFLMSLSR